MGNPNGRRSIQGGDRRRPAFARRICRQLLRPAPAARSARGAGRGRPLLVLLRRAVHAGMPDLDRHPAVHPRDRRPATRSARPRRSSTRTSSAACARGSARPRRSARRPACASMPRASRSQIGRLQRYATDIAMGEGKQLYKRAADRHEDRRGRRRPGRPCLRRTGWRCSAMRSRCSRRGRKAGGLNEYGIAAYKSTDDFAQAEVDYISAIGGIAIEHGRALGRDVHLVGSDRDYDAVFLGMGLGGVNALRAQARPPRASRTPSSSSRRCARRATSRPAGRPAHRRHRRRHDGDRRRRAVQAARRRRGHDRLSARPGADERLGLRAGAGDRQRRRDPPLAAAEAGHPDGGKVSGIEMEYTAMQGGRLVRHRRDHRARLPTRCSRRSARGSRRRR